MNPALITVIALGVVLVVAWDGFRLRDLIRADPATVRYLGFTISAAAPTAP